jgi:hypothetical protein
MDGRFEYVAESTEAEPPTDPSWSVLGDCIQDLSASPNGNREYSFCAGSGSTKTDYRGAEEHEFTTELFKERGFVDSNGDAIYPAADPLLYDYSDEYPTYTFQYRREVSSGGNFDSGFREYFVAFGARVEELSNPGDPSEGNPIVESLQWAASKSRPYVIHQPSSGTTLDVINNGSDSVEVTIEDEGASTSETVVVSGNSTTTTTESFADIDVIWVTSDHAGDIEVTDGSGTNVLDQPLAGSDTDNVESEQGIPPLGAGSHGSAVNGTPSDYLFQGVDTINWQSAALSDRIHALDLTVGLEMDRNAQAGTRKQAIDTGTRTAEADADVAGPYESAKLIRDQFRNESGDFVYSYPDNDVILKNASISDSPDYTRSAGETNFIPSVTFRGVQDDDTADVVVNYTG